MKALKIKPIKNEELLTARFVQERMRGNFDVHTAHLNQTNNVLLKIWENDIYTLTTDELKEVGEFVAKIQQLMMLLETNDVVYFTKVLENVSNFKKKYNKNDIMNIVSKENYNTKDTFNLRIKAYAYLLELNINTCHYILNMFKSTEATNYNKIKLNNLLECIWSGLSPEEIKIIFHLSKTEYHMLTSSLYVEKDILMKNLGDKFKNWHTTFVKCSEGITDILNTRLQGNFEVNTNNPELDYKNINQKLYDLENIESAVLAAEVSVKILFYLKLYPTMSPNNLKAQLEEMVKKDHVWTDAQLEEIKRFGKTKTAYVKELKEILADETGNALIDMKSQMIASICQLNQNSYKMINDMFVEVNPKEFELSFKDISDIIGLMRTDIKTECIQYIFKLDEDTINAFGKLFKTRVLEKNA